ncbi:MAG: response regulator transcription factor [Rhodanobacteraceae bacterium]
MKRLLIADDHPLFRVALRQAAAAVVADKDISETDNLADTLCALEQSNEIELVLLDLHMPGSHGLSGLAALRGQHPGVAVLVVSAHDTPRIVRRVLDHGAAGFISKSADNGEISAAIGSVLDGGEWVPPQLAAQVAAEPGEAEDRELAPRLARLTTQQFRVLSLLSEGLLNKQIADQLGVQERTVKAHATAIFDKLGVRNRTQASNLMHSLDLNPPAL